MGIRSILTADDVTEILGPVLYPGRLADMLNGRITERLQAQGLRPKPKMRICGICGEPFPDGKDTFCAPCVLD